MTHKDKHTAIAVLIFILNLCVLGPIGWIFTEQVREQYEFRNKVLILLIEERRKLSEVRKLAIRAGTVNGGQTQDIGEIRGRINRLESAVYELSNKHPGGSAGHGQE